MSESDKATYEVTAYPDQATYDSARSGIEIADGIETFEEALRIGRAELAESPIVKVQSSDRETGATLRRTTDVEHPGPNIARRS